MKRHLLIFFLFVFVGIATVEAAKPKVFIQTNAAGDEDGKLAASYLGYFESLIFNGLKENFPCVEISSTSTISTILQHERVRALLGAGDDNALQNIAGAIGCEYLVSLKVTVKNNTALIVAFCMDAKKAKTIARATENAAHGEAGLNAMEKVSKNLMEQLKEYEICPYEGKVTLEVKSEKEDNRTTSIPCQNGSVTTNVDQHWNSTLKWKLNKNGLRRGDGDVTYNLTEKTDIITNDPCYVCKNGNKGFAKITENIEVEGKTQGLSNESVSEGQKVADCRIKIMFLKDGTYTILVKAASQKGKLKTTTHKKIEGPCGGDEFPPEPPRTNEIEIPLDIVLGPYKGSATDKVLSQSETKDLSVGKEKNTLKIDFTLSRKN